MTDKEKKERESTILEIQSRKVVLEKIENAYKRLKKQAEAQYEKRKEPLLTITINLFFGWLEHQVAGKVLLQA